MRVEVTREERYWYPDDGGIVWLAGFMPVDPQTRSFLGREALRERGLIVAGAAGAAQFHADVLHSDAAAPGEPLTLRRDPANEHDANAIAVHTKDGGQLGWVPREIAAELAPQIDEGTTWTAVVLRELRASPRDPRSGATMLLAADEAIELVVR